MDHPFVPGTRVAIQVQGGWRAPASFKAGVVAKVYKRNFTLEGSPQQWRPHAPNGRWQNFWHASAAGAGSGSLRIWDDTTDADIAEKIAIAARYRRFEAARAIIDREQFSERVTDAVVESMEAAALALRPPKAEAAA